MHTEKQKGSRYVHLRISHLPVLLADRTAVPSWDGCIISKDTQEDIHPQDLGGPRGEIIRKLLAKATACTQCSIVGARNTASRRDLGQVFDMLRSYLHPGNPRGSSRQQYRAVKLFKS